MGNDIQMKKADFWKRIWTPITKSIPPNDKEGWVLIWNPAWKKGEPMVIESYIAHHTAKDLLEMEKVSVDRIFSHWCTITKPERK